MFDKLLTFSEIMNVLWSFTQAELTKGRNGGRDTETCLLKRKVPILTFVFCRTLDYDHTPDHTYNFTVVATDNGSPPNNGSATVRVTVTNVNDEDPVFMQSIEHVQVSEDASTNTVVHVVQAYDPDGDDVTYSFVGECCFSCLAAQVKAERSCGVV